MIRYLEIVLLSAGFTQFLSPEFQTENDSLSVQNPTCEGFVTIFHCIGFYYGGCIT